MVVYGDYLHHSVIDYSFLRRDSEKATGGTSRHWGAFPGGLRVFLITGVIAAFYSLGSKSKFETQGIYVWQQMGYIVNVWAIHIAGKERLSLYFPGSIAGPMK